MESKMSEETQDGLTTGVGDGNCVDDRVRGGRG